MKPPKKLINMTKQYDLLTGVKIADGFFSNLIGLMGKKHLDQNHALWLKSWSKLPHNNIHTCFMRIKIDAIFLDAEMKVTKLTTGIKPWRMVNASFKTYPHIGHGTDRLIYMDVLAFFQKIIEPE